LTLCIVDWGSMKKPREHNCTDLMMLLDLNSIVSVTSDILDFRLLTHPALLAHERQNEAPDDD